MIGEGSGPRALRWDAVAVAPAVALYLGLALYELLLIPTWVGDVADEGAYFLMSRNVWHYGAPLLDHGGSARWSASWSPGLSILLAPFGAFPLAGSVVVDRVAITITGVLFLVLGYVWMRRQLDLNRLEAGLATACVAASYALVWAGTRVLSDIPAAAALVGGVILLRSGRTRLGLGLLVLAVAMRPINVAALAAACAWLVLVQHRRRPTRAAVVAIAAGVATIAIVVAAGGFRSYLSQFVHPGSGGITRTLSEQSRELTWYPLSWFASDLSTPDGVARICLKLLSVGLLALVCLVAVRRRLDLEAMIVGATVVVLLLYRTDDATEARYLVPLSPFLVGAVFAGFRLWPRSSGVAAAALAGTAAIAGGVHHYASVTPSKSTLGASVDAKRSAYRWVKTHVPRSAQVVAVNDIQAFLYSGHPTVTEIRRLAPGGTFVVRMPPDSEEARHLLNGFRSHEVYRRGAVSVVQVDARTAPSSRERTP